MKAPLISLYTFRKEDRDMLTGLRNRTMPGRPNWAKEFAKIKDAAQGQVS